MDAFSYLSVLLSIILGLGITQVLTAFGRLIRGRAAVRVYWPPLLWAGLLLVIYVQSWWASFGLRDHGDWTFGAFLVVLLQSIGLYMAAALVLPETVAEPSDEGPDEAPTPRVADLRAHYERQAPWFFGFLMATVIASLLKDVVLSGSLPEAANVAFHIYLFVSAAIAIVVRRRWYHETIAVVTAAGFAVYIAALFSELR